MLRLASLLSIVIVACLSIGCGGSSKPYVIPVDSPFTPFQAPDPDDFEDDEDDDDARADLQAKDQD